MITYYIIKDTTSPMMVAAGRYLHYTLSKNNAKHFTSDVMARAFLAKIPDCENWKIIKFQRY